MHSSNPTTPAAESIFTPLIQIQTQLRHNPVGLLKVIAFVTQ